MGCSISALCNNSLFNVHQICTVCLAYEDETEEFFGLQPSSELSNQLPVPLTIRSTVNVIPKSIQLLKKLDDSNLFQIEFLFDSITPCSVKIYKDSFSVPLICRSFPAGFKQRFQFSEKDPWLELRNDDEKNDTFIITIRGMHNKAQDYYQVTICDVFIHEHNEELVTKQKMIYNGDTFIVKEIYGFQQDEDCSVCLTEKKNTVLLPCHHLCVCDSCALVLTTTINKCPICRSLIRSMIQVFPREREVIEDQDEEEEEEEGNDDSKRLNEAYPDDRDMSPMIMENVVDITIDLSESDAQSDKSI